MGSPPPLGNLEDVADDPRPGVVGFGEGYVLVGFLVGLLPLARAAAAPGAPGRATRGAFAVRAVLLAGSASEELDVVRDDVYLAPLGAVLGLPAAVLQPPLDEDGVALLLVVGYRLPELAPRADVEEVDLVGFRADAVYRQSEARYEHAFFGEPEFWVAGQVARERYPVERNHAVRSFLGGYSPPFVRR